MFGWFKPRVTAALADRALPGCAFSRKFGMEAARRRGEYKTGDAPCAAP